MGFASGKTGDSVVVANALVWSFTFVAFIVACLAGIGHRVSDIANDFIQSFAVEEDIVMAEGIQHPRAPYVVP